MVGHGEHQCVRQRGQEERGKREGERKKARGERQEDREKEG